MVAFSLKSINR